MKLNRTTFLAIALLLLVAFARLIPHPPNFTPVLAVALFGGAHFRRFWAFVVPLAAMLLTDLALHGLFMIDLRAFPGIHSGMWSVYLAFAAVVGIGLWLLSKRRRAIDIGMASLIGATAFFLISNFGVWLVSGFYPLNVAGLLTCYTAAIPFFGNTLLSTLIYSGVLFGSFAGLKRAVPTAGA